MLRFLECFNYLIISYLDYIFEGSNDIFNPTRLISY